MSPRRPHRGPAQDGFTIIEVMVAMVVLVVGVLGTLPLITGSLTSTSQTTAREQGTNLARDLVERTREASYANLSTSLAPATLRAMLPSTDNPSALSGSTFTVKLRNFTYTVKTFACSIDDPSDGIGQGNANFCAATSGTPIPGQTPPPGSASAVNVLGIAVGSGTLLTAVCNVVGPGSTILSAVSKVAPISVCPSGSTNAGNTVPYDSQPDDMRRVRIDVSWTAGGRSSSVSQTTLLINPQG